LNKKSKEAVICNRNTGSNKQAAYISVNRHSWQFI